MIGRLLIIALGATAIYLGGKARAANNLTYEIAKIQILGVEKEQLRLRLDFNIFNQSSEVLWFSNLNADILTNTRSIGRVVINKRVTISLGTTLLPVPVGIDLGQAGSAAIEYLATGKMPALRIRGSMQVSGISFPIDQQYSA